MANMNAVENDVLVAAWNASDNRQVRGLIRQSLGSCEIDFRGCKMKIYPRNNNTEFQIWRRGRPFEEPALRYICELYKGKKITAFDVGANAGIFSLRLALSARKTSKIIAFEPNPIMLKRLEYNITLNGFKTITTHNCAVSDETGTVDLLFEEGGNLGNGQLRTNAQQARSNSIPVEVKLLADFFPKKGPVDFLKVDVEGLEDRVIFPLLDQVSKDLRPERIYYEDKHNTAWKYDLNSRIKDCGYVIERDWKANKLFKRDV
ncbi:MAG: FkbM family methyltransferase [Proteobacteria bacterium]|nr:FkbM family methyltransferase [Pseudomonadota bacterium]